MFILVNTILFIAIFGYTAMTLVKFFKRSKEGDCGGCKSNCKCDTNTSSHKNLSLIHISEPTRQCCTSRMPSTA